jgi:hypothetical protein
MIIPVQKIAVKIAIKTYIFKFKVTIYVYTLKQRKHHVWNTYLLLYIYYFITLIMLHGTGYEPALKSFKKQLRVFNIFFNIRNIQRHLRWYR